jgi:hypothetical protein
MFLFKMYGHGGGSGCDVIKQMKHGGDLQIVWIM